VLAAVSHFEIQPEIQTGDHLALRFQDFDEPDRSSGGLSLGLDGKFRDFAHLGVDFCRGIPSGEGGLIGFRGGVRGESGGDKDQSEDKEEESVHGPKNIRKTLGVGQVLSRST